MRGRGVQRYRLAGTRTLALATTTSGPVVARLAGVRKPIPPEEPRDDGMFIHNEEARL
jgi:hypothetical protein